MKNNATPNVIDLIQEVIDGLSCLILCRIDEGGEEARVGCVRFLASVLDKAENARELLDEKQAASIPG